MRNASLTALALFAAPAAADEDLRFCPNRPSLGSSACTTKPGELQFEMSIADWERDRGAGMQSDTVQVGDFQARLGVGPTTEFQLGWTPVGLTRTRTDGGVSVRHASSSGDVRLGVRQALSGTDKNPLTFGIEPFVTLPVGRPPTGARGWEAGLTVPLTYQINEGTSIGLTAEADATLDKTGEGRHLASSAILTLGLDLTKSLKAYIEAEKAFDNDPSGSLTSSYLAQGLSLKISKKRSVWTEVVAGVGGAAQDIRVFGGFSLLF